MYLDSQTGLESQGDTAQAATVRKRWSRILKAQSAAKKSADADGGDAFFHMLRLLMAEWQTVRFKGEMDKAAGISKQIFELVDKAVQNKVGFSNACVCILA